MKRWPCVTGAFGFSVASHAKGLGQAGAGMGGRQHCTKGVHGCGMASHATEAFGCKEGLMCWAHRCKYGLCVHGLYVQDSLV